MTKSPRWTIGAAVGILIVASCNAQTAAMNGVKDAAFDANPAFAVVSIKLSPEEEAGDWGTQIRGHRFVATHVSMCDLIVYAYGLHKSQIEHAPEWFTSERFDVEGAPDTEALPTRDEYRTMVQKVLAERFHLRVHSGQKILSIYALSISSGGLKIRETVGEPNASEGWGIEQGRLQIKNMSFPSVARVIQRTIFDRPVVDQTGLEGRYTFNLRWHPDDSQFSQLQGLDVPADENAEGREDIYTEARKQLGLKIEAKKAMTPVIVIDTASLPTAN